MKLTSDAVEKWASGIQSRCTTPLTQSQAELMVNLFLNEMEIEEDEELKELCKNSEKGGLLPMIINRCKSLNFEITRTGVLFLESFLKTPGDVSMAAAYIRYKLREVVQNGKVNIGFLSTRCFPMGVPSEKDWNELWDMQKLDFDELKIQRKIFKMAPDNVLDYKSAYQSIM